MDAIDRKIQSRRKLAHVENQETAGKVADSHEVRVELMRKVHAGEITLVEAQNRLKIIQRESKHNGQITRAKAYANG